MRTLLYLTLPLGPAFALVTFAAGPDETPTEPPDRIGYDRVVAPFLRQHCVDCHGPDRPKGGFDVTALTPGSDWDGWRAVADRITLGEMPPEDRPRPDPAMSQRVVDWAVAELRKVGKAPSVLNLLPGHGNRVPHELLFGREPDPDAVPPPRLWRVSPHIYAQLITDLTKNRVAISGAFTSPPGEGFKDYAGLGPIDESTAGQLVRNARGIVGYQTRFTVGDDGRYRPQMGGQKEFVQLIDPAEQFTDERIDEAVRRQFQTVLLRAPDDEEAERFRSLMRRNVADAGREVGVRTTLAAVLLRPEVLFRSEAGAGEPDAHGRVMLAPREVAFALAYALTDRRPDGALLRAAEEGTLSIREGVAGQFDRIWDESKIDKPRVMRFFREYFGYHKAPEVFKERKDFPHHEPGILVADTEQLIRDVLDADRNVLVELLTTNKSYVNYRLDRKKGPVPAHEKNKVHMAYGLPEDWKWTNAQPVPFPKKSRAGILTQPSWLVAHSLNVENHPIIRGKWVRERLLGGTVPDLPITVDAQLPEDPDKTLRERMELTRQDYCWQCHRKMNPLGLAFEGFDHFGRPRSEELGRPVDTTGSIDFSGEPGLEGPVNGAVELIHKLARSERVRQVFVRHAFRYWMGRNETPADAKTLQDADAAYLRGGGSFKALVKSIVTSDSFLMRENAR